MYIQLLFCPIRVKAQGLSFFPFVQFNISALGYLYLWYRGSSLKSVMGATNSASNLDLEDFFSWRIYIKCQLVPKNNFFYIILWRLPRFLKVWKIITVDFVLKFSKYIGFKMLLLYVCTVFIACVVIFLNCFHSSFAFVNVDILVLLFVSYYFLRFQTHSKFHNH